MKALETRIPPLLLLLLFAAAMYGIATLKLARFHSGIFGLAVTAVLVGTGFVFCLLAVFQFRRAATTVNPTAPDKSTALITDGIFRISRNPMYVGFLAFLLAWGLYLSDGLALLLGLFFQPYLTAFQIVPEERALRKLFGDSYCTYLSNVRRWL
ncbi:Protein-S-isoprenylcysteine O-methyltransferase Ste14 [Microbulbifer donghaiensis]|uniref:Protein-S-isoprenylcysteine O-methyltransferase Ste14 n=1 Tax=Microbulbifer donghaiensis TaxID=494016 RepID=A0A1M4WGW0_9GAMM|nr:isoprenylcysteine carboxylmethyltransferase family protein [Microbulbifer donghaiensis]SHE80466.1 Protein-S-isoprenylcysteine O-methyltransferase Ste14 [Microbulbifer donghaiensis]